MSQLVLRFHNIIDANIADNKTKNKVKSIIKYLLDQDEETQSVIVKYVTSVINLQKHLNNKAKA